MLFKRRRVSCAIGAMSVRRHRGSMWMSLTMHSQQFLHQRGLVLAHIQRRHACHLQIAIHQHNNPMLSLTEERSVFEVDA